MPVPVRHAAKVILIDRAGRVLLFRGFDSTSPVEFIWFPPGGGMEPGESIEDAARREVREEVGIDIGELGPVVHEVKERFPVNGVEYDHHERYFVVRLDREVTVDNAGWTAVEREFIVDHHWWTAAELAATTDTVYPEGLLALYTQATSSERDAPK